jgi:hypothetical protein
MGVISTVLGLQGFLKSYFPELLESMNKAG